MTANVEQRTFVVYSVFIRTLHEPTGIITDGAEGLVLVHVQVKKKD